MVLSQNHEVIFFSIFCIRTTTAGITSSPLPPSPTIHGYHYPPAHTQHTHTLTPQCTYIQTYSQHTISITHHHHSYEYITILNDTCLYINYPINTLGLINTYNINCRNLSPHTDTIKFTTYNNTCHSTDHNILTYTQNLKYKQTNRNFYRLDLSYCRINYYFYYYFV